MGLRLQVRPSNSLMSTSCAADVTMAGGALQPTSGLLMSLILHATCRGPYLKCPSQQLYTCLHEYTCMCVYCI